VAFVGIPYDGGTPQPGLPTGQRGGPAAVRAAGEALFNYPDGWYDVEADRDPTRRATPRGRRRVSSPGS
jgi:hypothetical protein